MTDRVKRKTLVFLLLVTIATALLAAALPQLELKPGIPLPDWKGQREQLTMEDNLSATIPINTLVKAFLAVVVVLSLVYLIYEILKGSSWRNFLDDLRVIAGLLLLLLVVFCILFVLANNFGGISGSSEMDVLPPDSSVAGPPLGPLSSGLLGLVWIGLAVGLILLAFWLSYKQTRRTTVGDLLQLEVEQALQALRAGSDFKNVIVRCYQQMSAALQKEQGIELAETMTAREFERLLVNKGFPQAPVHQLTRLFEAARYGFRQTNPSDEQKAFECLNAIVQFSRGEPRP